MMSSPSGLVAFFDWLALAIAGGLFVVLLVVSVVGERRAVLRAQREARPRRRVEEEHESAA